MEFLNNGNIFVISSPSGGGKTSIVNLLKKTNNNIYVSVSYTSRPRRENEIDGVDYFFISEDEFQELIKKNFFLEYTKTFNNFYGIPNKIFSENLDKGIDMIFILNDIGFKKLKSIFKDKVIGIFILPDSKENMIQRLKNRNSETTQTFKYRCEDINNQLKTVHDYDYFVINDILENAVNKVCSIMQAEKLRCKNIKSL